MTKRSLRIASLLAAGLCAAAIYAGAARTIFARPQSKGKGGHADSRIQRGLEIAPVRLDLRGKNRALVGLGSYIVNAQSECIDCHSCPSFVDNPFDDGKGEFNPENYLAGGVPFGPEITSANLTPDEDGLPAGLTLEEFIDLIRTGIDPDEPDEFLPVMPWPIFRHMTDRDLMAIYEYLSAIPHAEPGNCNGPGEG
jgi:hypothetical protein